MLKGNVQVRQNLTLGHQRHYTVYVWVRVHIVHAHPNTQLAQFFSQLLELCFYRAPIDEIGTVFQINAISRRVLAHDQQFFHA